MHKFLYTLAQRKRLFFDGGLGTMLQAKGLWSGISPELFSLENPDVLKGIYAEYLQAGANILTTNTFGGSKFKLSSGLDVEKFNYQMVQIARLAIADFCSKRGEFESEPVFVAGSVGPTGHFVRPLGELAFDELVAVFRTQIRGLVKGGVDIILAETHFDLVELRAAVVATKLECDLPIITSMTFEKGVNLTGTTPQIFKETMLNMGVSVVATNCNAGPEEMLFVVKDLVLDCPVPVLAEPNAGLPQLENGKTLFRLGAEAFASAMLDLAKAGARILGGCCGTTPEHILATRKVINSALAGQELSAVSALPLEKPGIVLSSRSTMLHLGLDTELCIIGERINPTGKKILTAELQAGDFTKALFYAEEQIQVGAKILDVNVGAPTVDESIILPELVSRLSSQYQVILALDSSNIKAIEKALVVYPGSALVNSISGEEGKMEYLAPLCSLYGASFILLPLLGTKLPVSAKERIAILESLLIKVEDLGIPKRLIMVDVLALAISSNQDAALSCLETIRYCAEVLQLPTTIGLSNISFGMPARELLNASFLSMAFGHGLSSCIANIVNPRIKDTVFSCNALLNRKINVVSNAVNALELFTEKYADWVAIPNLQGTQNSQFEQNRNINELALTPSDSSIAQSNNNINLLEEAVIKGKGEQILSLIDEALADGVNPLAVVKEHLIPAITVVGEKYERKEYFLPQLLRAAETMQIAFSKLKPLLQEKGKEEEKTVVVFATVEGDIHDIGKNIVILMLSNHGFEVIDLGKDVKAEVVVKAAEENKAKIICLSALMTTTMMKMQEVVDLAIKKNLGAKVLVGGAVVTQAFADSIGADGYSADAVSCVRLAKSFS